MHLPDMEGMALQLSKAAVATQKSSFYEVNSCKLWFQLFPVCLVSCQPMTTILTRSGDRSDLSQLWVLPVHILDLFQYVLWSMPQSEFRMIAMKKILGIQKAYLLCIIKKATKDEKWSVFYSAKWDASRNVTVNILGLLCATPAFTFSPYWF